IRGRAVRRNCDRVDHAGGSGVPVIPPVWCSLAAHAPQIVYRGVIPRRLDVLHPNRERGSRHAFRAAVPDKCWRKLPFGGSPSSLGLITPVTELCQLFQGHRGRWRYHLISVATYSPPRDAGTQRQALVGSTFNTQSGEARGEQERRGLV